MKTRSVAVSALLTASAMVAANQPAPQASAADPISFSAHGAVYGPGGRQLKVTVDVVRAAQQHYADRLHAQASPSARLQFSEKRRRVAALAQGDVQTDLYGTSLLLDWYIREVQPADSALLAAKNRLLLRQLGSRLDGAGTVAPALRAQAWVPNDFVLALLAQDGLTLAAAAAPGFVVGQQRELYQKQCIKAGVPVPPAWGTAGWKSAGMPLGQPFIVTDKKAELFYWSGTKPAGVCLALPRYTAGSNDTNTLGIICMGEKTVADGAGNDRNSACFWDWEGPGTTKVTGLEVPLRDFAAGPGLSEAVGGPCSDCHAGNNSFVVHPDDAAFKNPNLPSLDSTGWYRPMVKATWPQNPLPTGTEKALGGIVLNPGEGDCLSCHRLPEMPKPLKAGDNTFCLILGTAVLGKNPGKLDEIKKTMPRPRDADDYTKHIDKLNDLCKAVGAGFKP